MICFFTQFLPWTLVPRGTYIYHYFAAVPFLILCTTLVFESIGTFYTRRVRRRALLRTGDPEAAGRYEKKADRDVLALVVFYIVLTAVLFVLLFPYASGWMVRTQWLDAVNWFHNLYY